MDGNVLKRMRAARKEAVRALAKDDSHVNDEIIRLNEKQQLAIDCAKQGKNLFITGSGGVGKSVVIRELETLFGSTALFLAPTGIAALNIQGSTLHRVFGLPFSVATDSDYFDVNSSTADLFSDGQITTIIIDEISMVRGDMFITIDEKLRRITHQNHLPFGGLQIIVVGDFFQLPPVLTRDDNDVYYQLYESLYAFNTDTWKQIEFDVIELDQVMRQDDENTIRALNSIRRGSKSQSVLKWINKQCQGNEVKCDEAVTLCTTNRIAGIINTVFFDDINEDEFTYYAIVEGRFNEKPVEPHLKLKKSCRVVICANNLFAGYSNGQCGEVLSLDDDSIMVQLDDGGTVKIGMKIWESYRYQRVKGKITKVVDGSFEQIPVKLGYAITIHKAQGMTLDECVLDLGTGAFSHGQTYVALSRIRSLKNLELERNIKRSDLIVDQEVIDFYKSLGL